MNGLKLVGRSAVALCLGALAASIVFGLLLGLAWLPPFSERVAYKTVTFLLVAGVSFAAGGYVSGLLAGRGRVLHGLALGLVLGLIAAAYILGPRWWLLAVVPVSGVLGALGGWLAARQAGEASSASVPGGGAV